MTPKSVKLLVKEAKMWSAPLPLVQNLNTPGEAISIASIFGSIFLIYLWYHQIS